MRRFSHASSVRLTTLRIGAFLVLGCGDGARLAVPLGNGASAMGGSAAPSAGLGSSVAGGAADGAGSGLPAGGAGSLATNLGTLTVEAVAPWKGDAKGAYTIIYGGTNSIYDGEGDILQIYVDLAIAGGGWSVREFHGIADATFWSISVDAYTAHLDYVKSKVEAGELWVATPSDVVRYRFARQYCGAPHVSGSSLMFGPASAECTTYASPLSVIIATEVDAPSVIALQDGSMVRAKKVSASRFRVDINPIGGVVTLAGG